MKTEQIVIWLLEKWKLRVWLKITLSSAIISLTVLYLVSDRLTILLIPAIILAAFLISFLVFRSSFPGIQEVIQLLNKQFPELEYSSDLFLQKELSGLAQVQQKMAARRLAYHYQSLKFPVRFDALLKIAAVGIVLASFKYFTGTGLEEDDPFSGPEVQAGKYVERAKPDSTVSDIALSIVPPEYSGLPAVHQSSLDAKKVLQGSVMYWKAVFNHQPRHVWLKFSNGDSIGLEKQDQHFLAKKKVRDKGFYTLNYLDQSGKVASSDYARLEVIPDNPPEVTIAGIPQYQSFPPSKNAGVSFSAKISDDYGLTGGYIIATVTKGSGESVKFREQKIPFPKDVQGKSFMATIRLSAGQFEMEAGNELYFYVEGVDNRQPNRQATKTETYFFVLEDTSEVAFSLEGDLGINLMPEYFRSQRQIIIDSEKLLKEKNSISKHEFHERSNELGFDQKALRLKYGQFIGEESESGLDIQNEAEDESQHQNPGQVDVLSEYGHDHDHENEEGQHMDRGTQNPKEDVVSELSHSHDDAEQATFFEQSVKTKLKAALKEMWDAELHLRLYHPEKSLPYQYKALKLLQEIKNHARIYVQRIGFDPPPVKEEESRLTGDLDEVHGEDYFTRQEDEIIFPEIKEVIQALDEISGKDLPMKNHLKNQLRAAGHEVAALAIEEPGKYLTLLSAVKSISEQDSIYTTEEVVSLRSQLLKVLPPPASKPSGQDYPEHILVEEFINELTDQP